MPTKFGHFSLCAILNFIHIIPKVHFLSSVFTQIKSKGEDPLSPAGENSTSRMLQKLVMQGLNYKFHFKLLYTQIANSALKCHLLIFLNLCILDCDQNDGVEIRLDDKDFHLEDGIQ